RPRWGGRPGRSSPRTGSLGRRPVGTPPGVLPHRPAAARPGSKTGWTTCSRTARGSRGAGRHRRRPRRQATQPGTGRGRGAVPRAASRAPVLPWRESVIPPARRLRAHTALGLLRVGARLALGGARSRRRREGLEYWYGPREALP